MAKHPICRASRNYVPCCILAYKHVMSHQHKSCAMLLYRELSRVALNGSHRVIPVLASLSKTVFESFRKSWCYLVQTYDPRL